MHTIEINEKVRAKLCKELGVKEVPIRILPSDPDGSAALGRCSLEIASYSNGDTTVASARIEIYLDKFKPWDPFYRWLLIDTILHEHRHLYQFANWDINQIRRENLLPYKQRPIERDARLFARRNVWKYWRIGKIKRVDLPQESRRPQVSHAVMERYQAEEMG